MDSGGEGGTGGGGSGWWVVEGREGLVVVGVVGG